jgi:hypothetical protein
VVPAVRRATIPDRVEAPPSTPVVPPPPDEKLPTVTVRVEPEWAYRRFVDVEPSATDKRFGTPGVFLVGGRAEVYPLARASGGALRDLGLTGSYARAVSLNLSGLASTDVNSNKSVDTQWYRYSAGLRYRALGRSGPFALGLNAGYERWVFDFDVPAVPAREVPTARYSLLEGGADARWSFGHFSVVVDATYMQPLSIAPLGDRRPSLQAFGVRGGLGAGLKFGVFEADLRGTFTLFRLQLDPVPGGSDAPGRVFDQYFGVRLAIGASF